MNSDNPIMYSSENVERTLDDNFLTEPLRDARKTELSFLQKEIGGVYEQFNTPLNILDIGIGDGHVLLNLGNEILKNIGTYVGIDNSPTEVENCTKNISKAGLGDKVKIFEFDADNLGSATFQQNLPTPLHIVISTYFTPGNFKPNEITLNKNDDHIRDYSYNSLSPNKRFQKVFSDAYKLLSDGGKLILGSTYIDSDENRLKQEEFYKKCGMSVITNSKDSFTATKEGFWSQRFTNEKIYSYLDWVSKENIRFIPLDSENFAQMIVVTKG